MTHSHSARRRLPLPSSGPAQYNARMGTQHESSPLPWVLAILVIGVTLAASKAGPLSIDAEQKLMAVAGLIAGPWVIWSLVRGINRRTDVRHHKGPPDPP